jgi:hypothetical protein
MLARVARAGILSALAVLFTLLGTPAPQAREASLRGAEMNGFGRIALEFDQTTKVSARVANGILVISFSEPVTLRGERLAAELPSYVSIVRRDPDGTGLRLALTSVFRPSVLEAGERVFIDLLPRNWTGLAPGLPQDVVTELARRAREAESQVRDESRRRQNEPPKPLAVRIAQLPTLTRAVFIPPKIAPVSFRTSGNEVSLHFDAPLTLEAGKLKPQLGAAVRAISAQPANGALVVKLTLEPGYEARGFREDETFVVDLAKPKPAAPSEALGTEAQGAAGQPATLSNVAQAGAAAVPPPRPAAGLVRPAVTVAPDGLRIVFPFTAATAAAAFERGGVATLLFHTSEAIEFPSLPAGALGHANRVEVAREGALAVVRLTLSEPQLIGFAPEEDRWVLTLGEKGVAASEPLTLTRSVGEAGLISLAVPLADPSGVHWLRDPQSGERLAVATAFGPTRGMSKPQTFVEFRLLPTAHGVVVAADADDLNVLSGPKGLLIGRSSGLALSPPGLSFGPEPTRPSDRLVIGRDESKERLGNVFDRYRALMRAVVEADGSGLSPARVELARFLVTIGMNAEAAGILDYAVQQDPALLRQTHALLLRGIAAAQMRRPGEARKALSAELLVENYEAVLWRAVLDAHASRWRQALSGFQRANLVLDLYPDELQGPIRLLAVRAALDMQDHRYAENELMAVHQLAAGTYSAQEAALLTARLNEAAGKLEDAAEAYRKLAMEAERPVAAEATARWVALAVRTRSMPHDEAIARLETLSFAWRGDEVEIATIGQLGRLYAEAGRWREAFTMAVRANRFFPDHEISRALHEGTGQLFDDLFLTGKGETLSRVDALALYFDFKQFTPIGRRGDEIVRRLADRLVELDLLEQASDLLHYQVEHRLTGAARATVAARLATINLMDNKPAAALAALHGTRLPELPLPIRRARMLLEARALSDVSRTDLAIEVLQGESGAEIDRLRADIYWTGRRWREAGEAHEELAGTRWQGPEPLPERTRLDVMRAAVAYSLAGEKLALDRLRAKFATKMADSADARTFAFLMRPDSAGTRAFRDIARTVTSADTLTDFLDEYRKRYPDAAASERRRATPEAASSPEPPARPHAQRAPGSAPAPNG